MKQLRIAGAVAGAMLLAAPTARAGDEFETAFKHELGRIAAHEVAGAGRRLLAVVLIGPGARPRHRRGGRWYPDPWLDARPLAHRFRRHEHARHHHRRYGRREGPPWRYRHHSHGPRCGCWR